MDVMIVMSRRREVLVRLKGVVVIAVPDMEPVECVPDKIRRMSDERPHRQAPGYFPGGHAECTACFAIAFALGPGLRFRLMRGLRQCLHGLPELPHELAGETGRFAVMGVVVVAGEFPSSPALIGRVRLALAVVLAAVRPRVPVHPRGAVGPFRQCGLKHRSGVRLRLRVCSPHSARHVSVRG